MRSLQRVLSAGARPRGSDTVSVCQKLDAKYAMARVPEVFGGPAALRLAGLTLDTFHHEDEAQVLTAETPAG